MKRFYEKYYLWEDFANGMYATEKLQNESELIEKAKNLLSDVYLFKEASIVMIRDWPISTKVNLTNKSINRKAWIGQAACCHKFGVPEILTRIAWGQLTERKRMDANRVAEQIINHFELVYERSNIELYSGLGAEML